MCFHYVYNGATYTDDIDFTVNKSGVVIIAGSDMAFAKGEILEFVLQDFALYVMNMYIDGVDQQPYTFISEMPH